ncbi:uncharacterized protein IUM83_10317 [Phytophthora cinnamomi]|uniref:uncharacterized protein n=1 Tax=Phytophthora cinnamomi TaxID=4785 RepID=UPI00355948F7|nr:hypothetical protein IUM83_10317 [Phytophthora cinnamomi]
MEPSGESMVLGMAGDAVLAALATVVQRPRKRAKPRPTQQDTVAAAVAPGPSIAAPIPVVATPPGTTTRVCPGPGVISPMQLPSAVATISSAVARTISPQPRITLPERLPSTATAPDSMAGPRRLSPIQLTLDSEEAIMDGDDGPGLDSETPVAEIPMEKCKEMIEFWRNNKSCTLADVARVGQCSVSQAVQWVAREKRGGGLVDKPKDRKSKWPVPKVVVEIAKVLAEIHFTDDTISRAAGAAGIPKGNVRCTRSEVKTRLQTAVVDHCVMLVIDLKKSYNFGLEGVKVLLEAGAQVCHCTEELQSNAAIFDGRILVQGSQSWTDNDRQGCNLNYMVVLTGSIVSEFECQYDVMWNEAIKAVEKGGK